MSENKTGGPAFPGIDYVSQHGKKNPEGMTLRDYFAAKAMQGLLAAHNPKVDVSEPIAKYAYAVADAMLEARK